MNLSYNLLRTLPPELAKFDSLVRLDLSNNRLTELPDAIGELTALKHLVSITLVMLPLPTQQARHNDSQHRGRISLATNWPVCRFHSGSCARSSGLT